MSERFTIRTYSETERFLGEQVVDLAGLHRFLVLDAGYASDQADDDIKAIQASGGTLLASRDNRRCYSITSAIAPDTTGNPVVQPYAGMPAVFTLPNGAMLTQVELLTAAAEGFADAFGVDEHNLADAWNVQSDAERRAACEIAIECLAGDTATKERRKAYTNIPPYFRLKDGSKVTAADVVDAAVKRHATAYAARGDDPVTIWNNLHPLLREAYIHVELERMNDATTTEGA